MASLLEMLLNEARKQREGATPPTQQFAPGSFEQLYTESENARKKLEMDHSTRQQVQEGRLPWIGAPGAPQQQFFSIPSLKRLISPNAPVEHMPAPTMKPLTAEEFSQLVPQTVQATTPAQTRPQRVRASAPRPAAPTTQQLAAQTTPEEKMLMDLAAEYNRGRTGMYADEYKGPILGSVIGSQGVQGLLKSGEVIQDSPEARSMNAFVENLRLRPQDFGPISVLKGTTGFTATPQAGPEPYPLTPQDAEAARLAQAQWDAEAFYRNNPELVQAVNTLLSGAGTREQERIRGTADLEKQKASDVAAMERLGPQLENALKVAGIQARGGVSAAAVGKTFNPLEALYRQMGPAQFMQFIQDVPQVLTKTAAPTAKGALTVNQAYTAARGEGMLPPEQVTARETLMSQLLQKHNYNANAAYTEFVQLMNKSK